MDSATVAILLAARVMQPGPPPSLETGKGRNGVVNQEAGVSAVAVTTASSSA